MEIKLEIPYNLLKKLKDMEFDLPILHVKSYFERYKH